MFDFDFMLHLSDFRLPDDFMLPNQRFFNPTQNFWDIMEQIVPKNVTVADLGCGTGELVAEGLSRGFKMIGVDLFRRSSITPDHVVIQDALKWSEANLSPTTWAMVCRPAHNGLARELRRIAEAKKTNLLYIGLPKNFELDLDVGWEDMYVTLGDDVGDDGEKFLAFTLTGWNDILHGAEMSAFLVAVKDLIVGAYYADNNGEIWYVTGCSVSAGVIMRNVKNVGKQVPPDEFSKQWKLTELRDFPNNPDPRLPYVFDLFWDLKYRSELIREMRQNDDPYLKERAGEYFKTVSDSSRDESNGATSKS